MPRKAKKSTPYRIACAFDTETTTLRNGKDSHAFVCLYIMNDLRCVNLQFYEPDKDEKISFLHYEDEVIAYFDELIQWGLNTTCIPVVIAYNLMFDMQSIIYDLNLKYHMVANAQSSSHVYTLDCLDDNGKIILRFWDTYHLEMRGLSAMGKTCGLKKAVGEWNYDLIRAPQTPFTEEEKFYAKRDVQVIPAYLSYVLGAHDWAKSEDLGLKIMTKTSLVRQMAIHNIGRLKVPKKDGSKLELLYAFEQLCQKELPPDYGIYALRKACFRGGFTFTSGKYANIVTENVCSMDVTSMHHLFINGRRIPQDFHECQPEILTKIVRNIVSMKLETVLSNYVWPFSVCFHACVTYKNLRLKKGSAFEAWQIALIPLEKFRAKVEPSKDYDDDEKNIFRENEIRAQGFIDHATNALFAFGKLYEAEECSVHINELEAWTIAQVYDYDDLTVNYGECTAASKIAPDYVTLQSNMLFNMKNECKFIEQHYKEGTPYEYEIPDSIPCGLRDELKQGICEEEFFHGYYNGVVKGMFNGIYGTMAQDVFKPKFEVVNGIIAVNKDDKLNYENFEEHIPKKCRVLYTYGMRIVGGSRMHLCIAMILLYKKFGNRIDVLGGDTDSLKIRCDYDVTDEELLDALQPLHEATQNAIDEGQERLRKLFPEYASPLTHIGQFEIEKCGGFPRYKKHMEAWNKARISLDQNDKTHITCAGLSRPLGTFTIEDFCDTFIQNGMTADELFPLILGYNTTIAYNLSYGLEQVRPKPTQMFMQDITDYLGNTYYVESHEAVSLYESARTIGSDLQRVNGQNIAYLESHGNDVDWSDKNLYRIGNHCFIEVGGEVKHECSALD